MRWRLCCAVTLSQANGRITRVIAAKTFTTLAGTPLTITTTNSGVFVNGILMTNRNIPATNGVIFMLDRALTP